MIPEPMKMLIPLDGSTVGDSILLSIYPLVRSRRVDCTVFHVAESPQGVDELRDRLEAQRKALEDAGVQATVRTATGKPAEEILHLAETGGFDLIAMATHGRTGMDRVVMGSIAEEVVRSSPVPVLLARPASRRGDWGHIVVALDGTPGAEEVLEDVVRLARSMNATVHLLRVGLSLLTGDAYRGVSYQLPSPDSTTYLEDVASRLAAEGIIAVPELRTGMAGVEIPLLAQELDAGLICMTTEGRPEQLPGLDRSIAAEVIRTAPCPVFVRRMITSRESSRSPDPV